MIKQYTSKRKIDRGQILIISFVWLLLFAIPVLFGDHPNGIRWAHVQKIWSEYMVVFIIFLLNRLVLIPQLFFKRKKIWYFTSIFVVIVLFVSTVFIHSKNNANRNFRGPLNQPRFEQFEHPPGFRPQQRLTGQREFVPAYGNLLILTILLIGFDSGLLFFSKWMQSEQNKLKAEKESIKNQMDFLQTQISPHFFMNTLNNIHALVDIDKEEAKTSIIKLSRLMDYMLYESQTKKILITKELDFIGSYVELMKLRYSDEVDIQLILPENIPSVQIPPLLPIAFIENAFKYGISYEKKSFIHIRVAINDSDITFRISNSIHNRHKQETNSGIGIVNTRKRLDLLYAENYKLKILNEKGIFDVTLNLPI